MKLLRTNNIETVKSCQYYFNFQPPSLLWSERVKKFDTKLAATLRGSLPGGAIRIAHYDVTDDVITRKV